MIREPQASFDLSPERDAPRPKVLARALKAAAPDGEQFFREAHALADRLAAERGPLHPSDLRIAARLAGIVPPKGKAEKAWWGSLVAQLLERGWRQVISVQRSPIASRNGAKEVYAYVPPENPS